MIDLYEQGIFSERNTVNAAEDVPTSAMDDASAGAAAGTRSGSRDDAGSIGAGMDKGSGSNKRFIFIVLLILAIVLVIVMVNLVGGGNSTSQFDQLISTGSRYLEEQEYEQAIVVFDSAIALEPRKAAGYLGKGTAEYELTWYEDAQETVTEGLDMAEDDTSGLEALLELIEEALDREAAGADEDAAAGEDSSEDEGAEPAAAEAEEEGGEAEEAEEDTWVTTWSGPGYTTTEKGDQTLLLNYVEMHVPVNTGDYEFQFEVLNDDGSTYQWSLGGQFGENDEDYRWSISSDGLLTFTTESAAAAEDPDDFDTVHINVFAEDSAGRSGRCDVYISGTSNLPSYNFRTVSEDTGRILAMYLFPGNGSQVFLLALADFVYYSGEMEIPDSLMYDGESYAVTRIKSDALEWATDLESIRIPASVTAIGTESADDPVNPFLNAQNLEKISVDKDNTRYKSIDGVLYSKNGYILYSYPAGKEDENFTLPAEVSTIYAGAFSGSRYLKEILVEEGNRYFTSEDGVLLYSVDAASVQLAAYPAGKDDAEYIIPDSVTSVKNHAFDGAGFTTLYTGELYSLTLSDMPSLEKIVCGDSLRVLDLSGLEQEVEVENADNLDQLIMPGEESD